MKKVTKIKMSINSFLINKEANKATYIYHLYRALYIEPHYPHTTSAF